METLLAVGNYLNGNTDFGQADGYALDVLNKLKETQEKVLVFSGSRCSSLTLYQTTKFCRRQFKCE